MRWPLAECRARGDAPAHIRPGGALMHTRWKALAAACAAALTLSGGTALAHDPEELSGGDPMASPFGEKFWFFANFQTAQNPFNTANTHLTSSDIAFWGDL